MDCLETTDCTCKECAEEMHKMLLSERLWKKFGDRKLLLTSLFENIPKEKCQFGIPQHYINNNDIKNITEILDDYNMSLDQFIKRIYYNIIKNGSSMKEIYKLSDEEYNWFLNEFNITSHLTLYKYTHDDDFITCSDYYDQEDETIHHIK
jgi:hypothetical protein